MSTTPYDLPYRVENDGDYGITLKFHSTMERDSFRSYVEMGRTAARNADRTWKHDRRWTPVSRAPWDARAVYSGRWIDQGSAFDVVPDRHGFAYDDEDARAELRVWLGNIAMQSKPESIPHGDDWQVVCQQGNGKVMMARRTGGYCYVEAWTR